MIEQHGSHSAVVTGSYTHNERIERLWRDVHRCVTSLFYDETDLHYVFLNRTETEFIDTWNNHPVSTARNLTPNQLFIRGALEQNMIPAMPHWHAQSAFSISNCTCRSSKNPILAK